MLYKVQTNSRGQITIPNKLRKLFKIKENQELIISDSEDSIIIKPVQKSNLLDLAGSMKTKKNTDVNEAIKKAKFLKAKRDNE